MTELKWAERERIAQNFVLYFSSRNNVLHIQHNIHPDKIYFKHLMWETILPNVFSYSVFQSYLGYDETIPYREYEITRGSQSAYFRHTVSPKGPLIFMQ